MKKYNELLEEIKRVYDVLKEMEKVSVENGFMTQDQFDENILNSTIEGFTMVADALDTQRKEFNYRVHLVQTIYGKTMEKAMLGVAVEKENEVEQDELVDDGVEFTRWMNERMSQ